MTYSIQTSHTFLLLMQKLCNGRMDSGMKKVWSKVPVCLSVQCVGGDPK